MFVWNKSLYVSHLQKSARFPFKAGDPHPFAPNQYHRFPHWTFLTASCLRLEPAGRALHCRTVSHYRVVSRRRCNVPSTSEPINLIGGQQLTTDGRAQSCKNVFHMSTGHVWPPAASQNMPRPLVRLHASNLTEGGNAPPPPPTPPNYFFSFPLSFPPLPEECFASHSITRTHSSFCASSCLFTRRTKEKKKLTLTIYMKRPHAFLVQFGFLSMHGESRLIHG